MARDDFKTNVKNAVAARAGHRCSFSDCGRLTSGPSYESNLAVTTIGIAAHIHAASEGGPRYLASQTPAERAGIDNAIWLCTIHAKAVDDDEVTYPADVLRAMKRAHEEQMHAELTNGERFADREGLSLFAIGPDIAALGRMTGSEGTRWEITLCDFVIGDRNALVTYGENFANLPLVEQYVVSNELGDGRTLAKAPKWQSMRDGLKVSLEVEPRFPRMRAQDLGTDFKLISHDDKYDLDLGSTVSGVDRLSQHILLSLSHQRGTTFFALELGTRLAEYWNLYRNTQWFRELLMMDAIRLASIPYVHVHPVSGEAEKLTHFECVERVISLEPLADERVNERLPVRVKLDVNGVGIWEQEIPIWVPDYVEVREAALETRSNLSMGSTMGPK